MWDCRRVRGTSNRMVSVMRAATSRRPPVHFVPQRATKAEALILAFTWTQSPQRAAKLAAADATVLDRRSKFKDSDSVLIWCPSVKWDVRLFRVVGRARAVQEARPVITKVPVTRAWCATANAPVSTRVKNQIVELPKSPPYRPISPYRPYSAVLVTNPLQRSVIPSISLHFTLKHHFSYCKNGIQLCHIQILFCVSFLSILSGQSSSCTIL